MRVTLRTLIAGQCGLLNPQQQATLDDQLQQHTAARSLYEHLGKLRQSSTPRTPPLSGTGLGIDPASVAGYLQRQLPADQAQAFERLAIESDQVLDELLALAPLASEMTRPHGLSSDRIQRVLAIGLDGRCRDGAKGVEELDIPVAAVTPDDSNRLNHVRSDRSVALATSETFSSRRYWILAGLIVPAAVAWLVLSLGNPPLPIRSAPVVADMAVAAPARQAAPLADGPPMTAKEPDVAATMRQDRSVVAASWEVAQSDLQRKTVTGAELGAKAELVVAGGRVASWEADQSIEAGDLSLVVGVNNLLGDPHHADSWHGWIDWVSHRCREELAWRERLELEIAQRPDNWQPVLKLLWRGVPQAGSDPIWRRWLLDALVHEQLEIRVLASYQYAKLTGMVPSTVDRNHAIQSLARWEERLKLGEPRR